MNVIGSLSCCDNGATSSLTERRVCEDAIIEEALSILRRRTSRASYTRVSSPELVKRHLVLTYGEEEREAFGVLWLDIKHRIIRREMLFSGTLSHVSVHPREVVKAGLNVNAACCILYHNHPSGETEPSEADLRVTTGLRDALALVDMRLLDHIIVAGADTYSFAEHGQL